MAIDLDTEMSAAFARVQPRHIERMAELGLSIRAIAEIGRTQTPFGLAVVEDIGSGFYQPAEDGPLSIIVPVTVEDMFGPVTIDLIAFQPKAPMRWLWRTGEAWALGEHLLDDEPPVELVASPLDWLREWGRVLCVLDWQFTAEQWHRLSRGAPLYSDDDMLCGKLNRAYAATILPICTPSNQYGAQRRAA